MRLSPRSLRSLTQDVDLLLFAMTTGSRHVLKRVRLGTHPCSRTRRMDVLDVLDGAKATWVGRVRPFAIFFSLFCLQLSTRPAHIPAQEFGRWTPPFSRDGIARLKSTPLCDIPFLPSPARVNVLLFATTRTGTPDLHARSHPCSRIGAMVHSFLTQQHPQAEEYVSLPYSPPSSAYSSRPGPHVSLLKNWYGGQDPSWR